MNESILMDVVVAALAGFAASYIGMRVTVARLEERLDAMAREIDNQVTHARERYDIMVGRLGALEARDK